MTLSSSPLERRLQLSGILLILGLLVEAFCFQKSSEPVSAHDQYKCNTIDLMLVSDVGWKD
jgi:hypothetical protein